VDHDRHTYSRELHDDSGGDLTMTVQPPHELDNTEDPPEGQVTKRKVTMRNFVGFHADGSPAYHEAVDYVPEEILEAYLADARTRWGYVEPGGYDAGPGGYHGATFYPPNLAIPNAGEYRPATPGSRVERALLEADARQGEYEAQPPPPESSDPTWNPTPPAGPAGADTDREA
jgi:hypothetical protein